MSEAAGTSPIRLSQELTIFHDVAKALTSSLNLDSILQTIMEKMAEYFRPDTWSLLMVDEEKDELYFAIAVGAAAEVLAKARLKVGEGIAGWVAKHGQLLIVHDVQNDPRFSSRLDEMTRLQTRSVICVPLRSKHRVLGVIQLVNADVGLSEQELFFLQALCDYAAISIENARAVEKIQELTITDDCTGLFNARHLHNRSRIPGQSAVAADRFCFPLRWRRVRGSAAANQQRSSGGGRETFAGFPARGDLLQRARLEPEAAREYGSGDFSERCADPARHHPSSGRDDVCGEEHDPR